MMTFGGVEILGFARYPWQYLIDAGWMVYRWFTAKTPDTFICWYTEFNDQQPNHIQSTLVMNLYAPGSVLLLQSMMTLIGVEQSIFCQLPSSVSSSQENKIKNTSHKKHVAI